MCVQVAACGETVDLWRGRSHSNGSVVLSEPASSSAYFPQYSIFIFSAFLEQEIAKHAANKPDNPLFVYASFQNVHAPLEVPRRFFDIYKSQGADVPGGADCLWNKTSGNGKHSSTGFKCDTDDSVPGLPGKTGFRGQACYCNRLIVKAQVSALDEAVRNLTRALQTAGLWENSVLVLQGDNGGPTFEAHSNFPLRGGKLNFFEGGVRTAGFVNSPLLPAVVRIARIHVANGGQHGLRFRVPSQAGHVTVVVVDHRVDTAVVCGHGAEVRRRQPAEGSPREPAARLEQRVEHLVVRGPSVALPCHGLGPRGQHGPGAVRLVEKHLLGIGFGV